MSEKREKKRRYNEKLEYIAHFEEWIAEFQKWVEQEPPVWRFIKWDTGYTEYSCSLFGGDCMQPCPLSFKYKIEKEKVNG